MLTQIATTETIMMIHRIHPKCEAGVERDVLHWNSRDELWGLPYQAQHLVEVTAVSRCTEQRH